MTTNELWDAIEDSLFCFNFLVDDSIREWMSRESVLTGFEHGLQSVMNASAEMLPFAVSHELLSKSGTRLADRLDGRIRRYRLAREECVAKKVPQSDLDEILNVVRISRESGSNLMIHGISAFVTGGVSIPVSAAIGGALALKKAKEQNKAEEEMEAATADLWEGTSALSFAAIWELIGDSQLAFPDRPETLERKFEHLWDTVLAVGRAHEDELPWKEVVERATRDVENLPDVAASHLNLAAAALEFGNLKVAENSAYQVTTLDPAQHSAVWILYRARMKSQQWDLAAETGQYLLDNIPEEEREQCAESIVAVLEEYPALAPVPGLIAMVELALSHIKEPNILTHYAKARLTATTGNGAEAWRLLREFAKTQFPTPEFLDVVRSTTEFQDLFETYPGLYTQIDHEFLVDFFFCFNDANGIFTGQIPSDRHKFETKIGSALRGEKLLLFCDITWRNNGANGVILTPTRLIWKSFASSPKEVRYSDLKGAFLEDELEETFGIETHSGDQSTGVTIAKKDFVARLVRYLNLCVRS